MKITSKNIWLNEKFSEATVEFEDGKIIKIVAGKEKDAVDYGNNYIIPGMIDIHTHGYGGGSSTDGNPEVLRNWLKHYPEEGVTTFLVGVMVRSEPAIKASLKAVADVMEEHLNGAEIYGTFLQAPFLDHDYSGTYNRYWLKEPTLDKIKEYIADSRNTIKTIVLAPEHDKDHSAIKYCVSQGIKVCLGFSGCTYEEAMKAMEDGATNVVHAFNCMPPLKSREPGLALAALLNNNTYSEVMVDGIHVHPGVMQLVGTMKGKDKLISITDSSNMKGLPVGFYNTDVRDIYVCEDGIGRMPNGKIAGSLKPMIENIKNMQELGKLPLVTAVNAVTINPATFLGINDTKGLIKEGYVADFAIYNDDYKIVQTYVHGKEML
jgi:N-acetylglucosamine-6-phosphate deacetylase